MAKMTYKQLAEALARQYADGIRSTKPDRAQEHLQHIASGQRDGELEDAAAERLAFNRPFNTNHREDG